VSYSPEAWPPDFPEHVFLARACSRLDREDVWRGLCTGGLEAVGSSRERANFAPVPLSQMLFSLQPDLKDQILDSCVIDLMDRQPIGRRIVRRRVPVPHWIYLVRASLDRFETALGPKATSRHEDYQQKAKPDSNRPRPVETGISAAFESLWSQGIPRHIRADDRDAQIKQYLVDNSYDVPNSPAALRRAVQRVLKAKR